MMTMTHSEFSNNTKTAEEQAEIQNGAWEIDPSVFFRGN